jgi:nucleoid-associated protein EbfC
MEPKALQQMLAQFRQVQEKLEKQIDELAVEASAGGGMVTVKMNGQKQLTEIRIEPDVFKGKDQEMLQELVLSAVNEASRRVDEALSKQMKDIAGGAPGIMGLKIPGMF